MGKEMTDLNIGKLVDDAVLEFGNARFIQGWEGAQEHHIKLLKHVSSMETNRTYKDRTYVDGLRDAIALISGNQEEAS